MLGQLGSRRDLSSSPNPDGPAGSVEHLGRERRELLGVHLKEAVVEELHLERSIEREERVQ